MEFYRHACVTFLLAVTAVQLSWSGIYKQRVILKGKQTETLTEPNSRKLIIMFFDALREDVVEFDDYTQQLTKLDPSREHAFRGQRI